MLFTPECLIAKTVVANIDVPIFKFQSQVYFHILANCCSSLALGKLKREKKMVRKGGLDSKGHIVKNKK